MFVAEGKVIILRIWEISRGSGGDVGCGVVGDNKTYGAFVIGKIRIICFDTKMTCQMDSDMCVFSPNRSIINH